MLTYPVPLPFEECVVAIGNFDGVHAGHKALLAVARDHADAAGVPLTVLTFEPHPRAVLLPDMPLKRLTPAPEKVARLEAEGAEVAVLPFTAEVASWSPEQFVEDVVVDWLGAHTVVIGENFRYGHKAAGDAESLQEDERFEVVIVPLLEDAGGVISSRRLRQEG